MQLMIIPSERAGSRALARWTALTGFATGFVWCVPATYILSDLGYAALGVYPLLALTSSLASALQSHAWVSAEHPDHGRSSWAAEWTLALGGIGPNFLFAALFAGEGAALAHIFGFGLAASGAAGSLAGLAANILATALLGVFGLGLLPGMPAAWAVGQPDARSGFRHLFRVMCGWYTAHLAACAGFSWMLGLL